MPSVADKVFESCAAGDLPSTLTRASLPAPGMLVACKGNIPPPPSLLKAQQSESTKLGELTPNETIIYKRVHAPTQLVGKTQTESNGIESNNVNNENLEDYDTLPFIQRKRHMKAVMDDREATQVAESRPTSHDMDKQTTSVKNWPKMADYPLQDRQVIGTAIEFYHTLLLTENPFPESCEELDWVREAFDASYNYYKVSSHTKLDPNRIKIISVDLGNMLNTQYLLDYYVWFKSTGVIQIKCKVIYRLVIQIPTRRWDSHQGEQPEAGNRVEVQELHPHPTGIYKNNMIQQVINKILFKKKDDEGIKWVEYYDPFSKLAFALTLTAVSKHESVHFKEDEYKGLYKQHLKTLDYFDEQTKKQDILPKILQGIFDNGRLSTGIDNKQSTSIIAITSDLIDDTIKEFDWENEQIKEIKEEEEQSGWWLEDKTQLEWDVEDKIFEGLDESVE
ncbi:hypothetical protein HD554DRAFT_2171658 [Boletus coccyginus]|nr:hypothetical protein HD554DRAFT_2171658 [Boletus coccyginus]